jgi:hypothetical protein
MRRPTK